MTYLQIRILDDSGRWIAESMQRMPLTTALLLSRHFTKIVIEAMAVMKENDQEQEH